MATNTNTESTRFGVRVGDDGRWHGKFASLGEARVFAAQFSKENSLGKAQIVDFADGYRETWERGSRL